MFFKVAEILGVGTAVRWLFKAFMTPLIYEQNEEFAYATALAWEVLDMSQRKMYALAEAQMHGEVYNFFGDDLEFMNAWLSFLVDLNADAIIPHAIWQIRIFENSDSFQQQPPAADRLHQGLPTAVGRP